MTNRRFPIRGCSGVLPLHAIDFLLGVNRTADEIAKFHAEGISYDAFFPFDELCTRDYAALWQKHRTFLRAEARRRGIPCPPAASANGPDDGA